ncbi:hypothetical protein [Bradyrhizobium ottawaense]
MKTKVLPRFPSSVTAQTPIILTRSGGNYDFSLDEDQLRKDIGAPSIADMQTYVAQSQAYANDAAAFADNSSAFADDAASSAAAAEAAISFLADSLPTYPTRAVAAAATISTNFASVVIVRSISGSPASYATYVPGTSSGPEAFQEAGGNWWELDLSQSPINCWWFKRSTDFGDDGLMLTRFFAAVNEQSQFGAGYGGLGVIPGGITYNLAATVPIAVCNYRRTKVSAAGAVFKTNGAIFAFTITGGGYSGGITLEDFCVYQQGNATALGAFTLKGTGGIHLVRPHVIGGQTTNTGYVGINLTLSNASDPSTGCLWTQIEKPQIYSFTADQVPTGAFLEGAANETRIVGGHFGICTRGVWVNSSVSPYYFPNNVKIRDVSFETCTYGVYCTGVIGNANTKPEGLKVTGCRFESMSQAAIALVNMDQTALNLPEFRDNFFTGTLTLLYNPNAVGVRSTDYPKDLAATVAFTANTAKDITFVFAQSSASYVVVIDAPANQPFWITNKTAAGFRINTTPALTATVGWSITRLA